MTAAAPSANPLLRSATIEMIGTGNAFESLHLLEATEQFPPSMLGSMISSVMSDNGCCATIRSAASADAACST